MNRQETLASLQLLLEYARDELDAVGLPGAATLAADAMALVRAELDPAKPPRAPRPRPRGTPAGTLHLVFSRGAGDRTRGG